MNKFLLILYLLIFPSLLHAQKDANTYALNQTYAVKESADLNINIYPVPVRNDNFTIKSNKDISSVKVTNIIGQDIFRIKYNDPQRIIKISLDSPQRGMYLVTIIFNDGMRVVKKIMIEESN